MMSPEYYKWKACDILYESGNPENIDKEFIENIVAELLKTIGELDERVTNLERRTVND